MTLFVLIFWILFLEAILLLCIGMMFWKTKNSSYGQDTLFPRYQFPSEKNPGEPFAETSPVKTLFDDTRERLYSLTADVEKLTREVRMLKRAIVAAQSAKSVADDWAETVSSLQHKLDELAEGLSSLEERPAENRELESLFKLEKKLELRLAKLERSMESLVRKVAEGGQQPFETGQSALMKEQIEVLREELGHTATAAHERLRDSLSSLIEEAISPLRLELHEISGNLKGKDTERSADNQRIMQGLTAEPPADVDNVSPEPEERSSRPPRILSKAARELYQDIVDLWDSGESITSITSQTGVGSEEVKLIVAGRENRPVFPEGQETS